ncbi:alpha/beta knot [Apiospora sp. TS-2023a]
MRLPNALCSPCRHNVLFLSRSTILLRNVHHVPIRHSSLSAIHRGLRDSEKSRPQGFRPTALSTTDSGRYKPARTTSRTRSESGFEKATFHIHRGKKNIADKGPEPKSRRARFNDPEESFGKKSFVYKAKNGPLREQLASLGEPDPSQPMVPQRRTSRSDDQPTPRRPESKFDQFESSFNNKTGDRNNRSTPKKFEDRRGHRDSDSRSTNFSSGRGRGDFKGRSFDSSSGRGARSFDRSTNYSSGGRNDDFKGRSFDSSSGRGGRSFNRSANFSSGGRSDDFKGKSFDSSSGRGERSFDRSANFSSRRRSDDFKGRSFDSAPRGRGGRDFGPRRGGSSGGGQMGERKPWDGHERRPRDFERGDEQQFGNGYERRVADREARFSSGEDLPGSCPPYNGSIPVPLWALCCGSSTEKLRKKGDIHLEKLAMGQGIRVQKIRDKDGLRSMDKMAGGRPHNGCVLEASPLPQLPLKALGPVSEDPDKAGFSVELAYQSAEDAAINGSPDFLPYRGPKDRKPFILLLDGILDPGNLGAILRTAGFLGVTGIAITKHSSASLTPVALKASAGASEVISLYSVDSTLGFIECSKEAGWMIYAAVAAGPRSRGNSHLSLDRLESYDPLASQPSILVVGSEGEGLGKQVRRAADFEVSIPGAAGLLSTIDSLNVSVATGILCSSFLKKSQGFEIEEEAVALETDDKLW